MNNTTDNMIETPQPSEQLDYLGFTLGRWQALLEAMGEKPYHANEIMKWLHHPLVKKSLINKS